MRFIKYFLLSALLLVSVAVISNAASDTPKSALGIPSIIIQNETFATVTIALIIDSKTYSKNGESLSLDVPPYVSAEGRTMVPLRFIAEGIGATATWDDSQKTSIIELNGNTIYCKVGEALPDNMGTPVIKNDRLFVPIRYIATSLGADVNWDDKERRVIISIGQNNKYRMLSLSDFPEGFNYVESYQFDDGYPAGITPREAALKAVEAYIAYDAYQREILKAPMPAKPINVVVAGYTDYSDLYDMKCYKIEFYSGGELVDGFEIDLNGNRYRNLGRGPMLFDDDYYVVSANSFE